MNSERKTLCLLLILALLLVALCACGGSVNNDDSVTHLGNHAFNDCFKLTSITIPDSVTEFGNAILHHCMNPVIRCNSGSAAEAYANTYGISVETAS